jgi:predicted amidohydrolase YtcJ
MLQVHRLFRRVAWSVALVLAAVALPARAQVPPELIAYPDLILINGKIVTVDPDFTVAEAVAARDGRFLAIGTTDDIKKLAGPNTKVVDLAGKSVLPGLLATDGDNSFAGGDLYKDTMVNGKVGTKIQGASVGEMLEQARALIKQAAPGSPVFLRMADEFVNDFSKLTVTDADALAPNNPLMLAFSSSEGLVNTAMLERAFAAGLPRDHIGIVRDAAGKPTGQLYSTALGMVGWNLRDWPELTEEVFKQQEDINESMLRDGVTTVTGHASGYTVTIISQMFHDGRLKVRFRPTLDFARQNPLAAQFLRRTPTLVNFGLGDGMVKIAGAALGPVDGASDDGGILTHKPKLREHPEVGGGPFGRNKWTGSSFTGKQWGDLTPEERAQTEAGTLFLMRKHGWNISGNHNMGSQATAVVLETLAAAEQQPDIKVHKMLRRNSLDHNLIWDEVSIGLAKQLGDKMAFGLTAEVFSPRLVRGEDMLMSQYGEQGMNTMQPVKDLIAAGISVHSEGVEMPLYRLERWVTRTSGFRTRSERRSGASRTQRVIAPDQALDRKEALKMLTIYTAQFMSEEDMLGSIEKGKYADMVVLDGDFMTVPDDKIDELEPVMTIVGGEIVFDAAAER